MKPRVLVLVLSADPGVFAQLTSAIRDTWGNDTREDFRVMYYYGFRPEGPRPRVGEVIRDGDVLVAGIPAGVKSILPETLMVFDHVRRSMMQDYDYIFRCCAGSYLVRDELLRWIDDKPRDGLWAGVTGPFNDPTWNFVSGSGFFLSPDLLNMVVDNRREILSYYPGDYEMDDVAIGRFLWTHGVRSVNAPRVNGGRMEQVTVEPGQYHYHFGPFPARLRALHALLGGGQ